MNFLLQHLELHIDETSLLQGERLLEGNQISYCAEQEKNLWVATVEAGRTHEIEVKISPSRVTAATCECDRFLHTGMCGHIAAVLLQVRNVQQARKENVRQSTLPRRIKLNAEMILSAAPTEDLLAFLREYARQDRSFSLALKARFAGMVTGIGSQEKYVQIIESAISMARKPDRTLNKKGSQQLFGAVQELLAQAEDHCARELY
ncbi:MAG: SWIM zinc finger family protein, partial [Saprospiraceae bacterium]|nr:SWIM zinc finger family protein [Saprospiraceae bacterium]